MAQIKIYGLRTYLDRHREGLSEAIHSAVMEALSYPPEKKFHRFFPLEPEDFLFPSDRSPSYTILEISMFQGRSSETKKTLIRQLFLKINQTCGIQAQDLEITIFETPRENWGIRGIPGDELALDYKVDV